MQINLEDDHPLSAVLNDIDVFVYRTDLEGRYTYANAKVLRFLGNKKLEDVLGEFFWEILHIPKDHSAYETTRLVLEEGQTIEEEEQHLVPSDNKIHYYWSIKKPIFKDDQIIGLLGISYDITEKKQLEEQLNLQNQFLEATLTHMDALVYVKDVNRCFVYANAKTAAVFGFSVEEIVGRKDTDIVPRKIADEFWEIDQQVIKTKQTYYGEQLILNRKYQQRHYWSVIAPWKTQQGLDAVIGVSTDITELHELREELQREAYTDGLTGVLNRRYFNRMAIQIFEESREQAECFSLMSIDIDHFKNINDKYGHLVGDEVLIHFVQCCQSLVREQDIFARTGGEEFCILLRHTTLEQAWERAEQIRQHVCSQPMSKTVPALRASASFGVATLCPSDTDFFQIFSRGDRALYLAKQQGRNRCCTL